MINYLYDLLQSEYVILNVTKPYLLPDPSASAWRSPCGTALFLKVVSRQREQLLKKNLRRPNGTIVKTLDCLNYGTSLMERDHVRRSRNLTSVLIGLRCDDLSMGFGWKRLHRQFPLPPPDRSVSTTVNLT